MGLDSSVDFFSTRAGNEISGAAVMTVFAPTNAAFERLPEELRRFLFSPRGRDVLKKILQYHIMPNMAVSTGECDCTFHSS